ncbi:hypothetical protein BJ322DRAFT_1108124 [Thelephora terrestris]|uniref:Uncharacterized protein n=1 Tax=Thelephora terrestris TaxID=56493 RepID=A0A9P6L826_9AGAM|nr:hypothetical protein BJ322DRAFT_1108124 [Thelephora terrestris]
MSALHSNASSPILITSGSSDHSDPAIWVTSSPRADFSGAGTSRSGLLGPPRFPNPTTFAPHLPAMPYNRDHEFDEMRNECHQLRQRVTRLETDLARSQGNVFTLTASYNYLVDNLGKKLDATTTNIEAMVNRITPGYAAPSSVSHIPLNPSKDDWAHKIPYWTKKAWTELKYSRDAGNLTTSVSTAFLEDEFGNTVPEGVRDAVYKDVRGFFLDKSQDPDTRDKLGPREQIGFELAEAFRITLEGKYPWLRLCDGHWKVSQLWTNVWSSWSSNHASPRSSPTSDEDKKINIGNKRDHTDDSDTSDPSIKKIKIDKGKGVDKGNGVDKLPTPVPAPVPAPKNSRPKPTLKKIVAKVPGKTKNLFAGFRVPTPTVFQNAVPMTSATDPGRVIVPATPSLPSSPPVAGTSKIPIANSAMVSIPPTPSPPSSPRISPPSLQVGKSLPADDVPGIAHYSMSPANNILPSHVVPIPSTPPPPGAAGDPDQSDAETTPQESSVTLSSSGKPAPKKKRTSQKQKCFEAWSKENEGGLNAFNTAWGRLSKEQKQEFAKTLLSKN